jgi:DNA-binding transcriptional regulator YhcF (GntR family)
MSESVRSDSDTLNPDKSESVLDPVAEFLVRSLDKNLPVPLGVQLRGLIEYGVACGALKQGARLPSIRVVASASGISPETVATAYRALQERGLLSSRHGSGTFIQETETAPSSKVNALVETERCVDEMLRAARTAGLSITDLVTIIRARDILSDRPASVRVVMVGIFEEASHAYAEDLAAYLDPADQVTPVTIAQLAAHLELGPIADLYVCLPTRQREVSALVGDKALIATLSVIPAERTRSFLARLDPEATLGLVSRFPGFLGLMLAGAHSFAPHIRRIEAMLIDDPKLESKLQKASVVVYATGADEVMQRLPQGVEGFEYRHTPDPNAIRERIVPLVEEFRHRRRLVADTERTTK